MRKGIYLPILGILGIAAGELMILSGQVFTGLVIHTINLLRIILNLIFSSPSQEIKNVLHIY